MKIEDLARVDFCEYEDTLNCCLGETAVIRYIIAPKKKELDVGVDTLLDPSIPIVIKKNCVTKKVNVTDKGFDLQILCPVCGKVIDTVMGFDRDWEIFSGPDYYLKSIPINEIPKEAIIATNFDISKNPSLSELDKWFNKKRKS